MIKDGKLEKDVLIKISYKDGSVDNYCRWQDDKFVIYYNNGKTETDGCLDIINFLKHNDELIVEILEEENKIPEKLELPSFNEFKTMTPEARYVVTAKEYDVLNDIIDYLKSKGE